MAENIVINLQLDDRGTVKQVTRQTDNLAGSMDRAALSTHSADRRLKGAAATSANGVKNFSKMSQGITGGLVPAYATLAANVFAVSAAFNFLKNAADVANLEESQVAFANNTGTALSTMTARLREASGGMLGFQEAASASAIGVAKGFSPSQMEELAEGARKASTALGRDFGDAFDRLVRGVSKAEPELLDELGITLRLETATKNYAAQLGKSADALTAAERSQAVYLETQKQLVDQFGEVEAATNPFTQLGVVFNDLVKNVTQFLLPAFKGLATFLINNAQTAALAFGLIGLSIFKSIPGVQELGEKMKAIGKGPGVKDAIQDFKKWKGGIEDTRQSLEQLQEQATKKVKGIAGQMQADRGDKAGKIVGKLGRGEAIGGRDKATLNRALKRAEAQYKKHGEVVSGIFKGEDIKRLKHFKKAFKDMNRTTNTFGRKAKNVFKGMRKVATITFRGIATTARGAFRAVAFGARMAGKAMSMAMKATVVLAVIQAVLDGFEKMMNSPATLAKSIINTIANMGKALQFGLNLAVDLINRLVTKLPNWAKKLIGIEGQQDPIKPFTFADDAAEKLTKMMETVTGVKMADLEATERAADAEKARLDRIKELTAAFRDQGNEISTLATGISDRLAKEGESAAVGLQRARAIATAGVLKSLKEAIGNDELMATLREEFKDLEGINKDFFDAVMAGDIAKVEQFQTVSGAYVANLAALQDGINNIATQVKSSDLLGAEIFLEGLKNTSEAAIKNAEDLNIITDAKEKLDNVFKEAGGTTKFIEDLKAVRVERERLQVNSEKLNTLEAQAARNGKLVRDQQKLEIKSLKEINKLKLLENELDQKLLVDKMTLTQAEQTALNQEIALIRQKILTQTSLAQQAIRAQTDLGKITMQVGDQFQTSFATAFEEIIKGTKNAADAFRSMAKSIVASLSKVIAQIIALKLIEASSSILSSMFGAPRGIAPGQPGYQPINAQTPPLPPASSASAPGSIQVRYGGITEPRGFRYGGKTQDYSRGGIARGRDSGYNAVLHGTEAIVPLPHGRAIPVEFMKTGNSMSNNTNVVVNMSSDGNASMEQSGDQGEGLGKALANAVQQELQKQKRPGGILSPYGAS